MKLIGLLILAVICACTQARNVQMMSIVWAKSPRMGDSGIAKNCGKSAITATWTPKDISSSGQVTASVNFTAPYDMNGGAVEVDVYNHLDGSIVFQYGTPFTCSDIKKWIPCPLKAGQFISMQKTFTDLSVLGSYLGTYDIVTKVSNENDQQMLCLNATVTVTE